MNQRDWPSSLCRHFDFVVTAVDDCEDSARSSAVSLVVVTSNEGAAVAGSSSICRRFFFVFLLACQLLSFALEQSSWPDRFPGKGSSEVELWSRRLLRVQEVQDHLRRSLPRRPQYHRICDRLSCRGCILLAMARAATKERQILTKHRPYHHLV